MNKLSRREFTLGSLTLGITAALGAGGSSKAAAMPLDPNDPTAKALGFVADAKQVNATQNPMFKPTQKCATCAQYQGKASDALAPCNIFGGKTVPNGGWCKVWVVRPA